jgi:hypothetical protein
MIKHKLTQEARDEIFAEVYAATNSPKQAMIAAEPALADRPAYASTKAARKLKQHDIQDKITKKLEKMSKKALKSIDTLISSDNEEISFKSSKFVIEHVRGKPIARHIGLNATASLEDVLAALQ